MSKRKVSKKSKTRLIIFGIPCVIIIIYFLIQLLLYAYQIYNLNQEYSHLKAEYNKLKIEEKEKRSELEKYQNEDGLAKFAREKFDYTKKDEYKIKIKETEEEKEDVSFKDYIINNIKNINIDYPYVIYGVIGITIFVIIMKSKKKEED